MLTQPTSILCHSGDVITRELDGEFIIVYINSKDEKLEDALFSLNDSGKAIWDLVDGKKTVAELVKDLAEEYEANPGEIEIDVLKLLDTLVRKKLLTESQLT
jgi:coenzyme PQQ biosynthesis protein PqqD